MKRTFLVLIFLFIIQAQGYSQLSLTDNSLTITGSGPFDHTYAHHSSSTVLPAEMLGGRIPPEHPEDTEYLTYVGSETIDDEWWSRMGK